MAYQVRATFLTHLNVFNLFMLTIFVSCNTLNIFIKLLIFSILLLLILLNFLVNLYTFFIFTIRKTRNKISVPYLINDIARCG
jgi:hypothetical protein